MLSISLVAFGLVAVAVAVSASTSDSGIAGDRLRTYPRRSGHGHLKKRCKAVKASYTAPSSSSNAITSNNATTIASSTTWLKRNCVTWGWIPDDGIKEHGSTGVLETPAMLDKLVGVPTKFYGAYDHVQGDKYQKGDPSTYFTGHDVLPYIEYLKGTGAVAVLSIMPVYGFGGMTSSDNTQALQIAAVVKKFDDAGIAVYLRWGHEMNWYFSPNSDDAGSGSAYYLGSPSDYIAAWKVVTKAVRAAVPATKMFWSPNIGSTSDYAKYWPGADVVDVVGVDYYPNGNYDSLASHVQNIHDTYSKANNIPFHIGETGAIADQSTKLKWADMVTSASTCASLPKLQAVHWFNYHKGGDFRLTGSASDAASFLRVMQS